MFGKEPSAADNLFGKTFRTDGVSFKSSTTKRPFLRFNYLPADRRRCERHNPPPYILPDIYIYIYLSSFLDPRLVRPPSLNPFPPPAPAVPRLCRELFHAKAAEFSISFVTGKRKIN